MPKANDLEGPQDQGGKHGGQAGMPRPASGGPSADQGIVRERGDNVSPFPFPAPLPERHPRHLGAR